MQALILGIAMLTTDAIAYMDHNRLSYSDDDLADLRAVRRLIT